jgi:hypothetical protein
MSRGDEPISTTENMKPTGLLEKSFRKSKIPLDKLKNI